MKPVLKISGINKPDYQEDFSLLMAIKKEWPKTVPPKRPYRDRDGAEEKSLRPSSRIPFFLFPPRLVDQMTEQKVRVDSP